MTEQSYALRLADALDPATIHARKEQNMNDIIRMAREAGFESSEYGLNCTPGMYAYNMEIVERFFQAAYAAGAAVEREVCAKVCEGVHARHIAEYGDYVGETYAAECAAAIRARKEKT